MPDAWNLDTRRLASAMVWILFVIILVITLIQLRAARRWVHYETER